MATTAQLSLFSASAPAHDPGGKVRLRLQPGVTGDALFHGARNEYRLWLKRQWEPGDPLYALWIGMNGSTAGADIDDPTVRREIDFTRRLGYGAYVKVNVMDYTATKPPMLLAAGVVPCSTRNVPTIMEFASGAAKIVLAHGTLPKPLRQYAEAVVDRLLADGHELWCLGTTADGSPRHPLYLRSDAQLVPFSPRVGA